ncbi:tetraspanin-36-like [Bombina bombina]|uniref:tetraspanin-36-like n=1 Tax=Bombina bombina TaxID=8345 RepID=UPI00235AFD5A|nr:tetraspanin-36-like [Bombina bombina]
MRLLVFTSKTFLLLLSLVFLAAAALCYVGATLIATYRSYEDFLSNTYVMLPAVIILGVAAVTFIIGILGCCATLKESCFGMGCLLGLISIIFAAAVAALVLGLVYKDKLNPTLQANMQVLFQKDDGKGIESAAVDFLQKEIQCCGVRNYTDWMNNTWAQRQKSNTTVPVSCCMKNSTPCNMDFKELKEINKEGCGTKLETIIQRVLSYALLVVLAFAIIELLGLISICIVSCRPARSGYQLL